MILIATIILSATAVLLATAVYHANALTRRSRERAIRDRRIAQLELELDIDDAVTYTAKGTAFSRGTSHYYETYMDGRRFSPDYRNVGGTICM
jgi:uncharacterized protein involved in propanediol utilization